MTWSSIFRDRDSGRIAIAVATKFFAVGARVPYIEPQKGAIATQALLNPLYGADGLKLIRDGVGAQDVVRLLTGATKVATTASSMCWAPTAGSPPIPAPNAWTGAGTGSAMTSRSPATCWPARKSSARPCA
jgi:hypothetical protein